MSENNSSVQFSFNTKAAIRALLCDPAQRELVYQAVKEGPAPTMTEQLGFVNMGSKENQEWYTLFPATDRNKKAGDTGLFYTAQKSGLPLFRFKKQMAKAQVASTAAPAEVASAPMPDINEIARSLGMTREALIAAAAAASYKPAEETTAVDVAPEDDLPADIAAIIGL